MKQEDKIFEVKCFTEEEIEQNKVKEAIKLNNQKWERALEYVVGDWRIYDKRGFINTLKSKMEAFNE